MENTSTTGSGTVQEFRADPKMWLVQACTLGLVGLLIAMGIGYYKRRNLQQTLLIGLIVGVVGFIFLLIKSKRRGTTALILRENDLLIEDKLERTMIPWSDVTKVQLMRSGEQGWDFHCKGRSEPVKFPLMGFLKEQQDAITAALVKRVPCEEQTMPGQFKPLN